VGDWPGGFFFFLSIGKAKKERSSVPSKRDVTLRLEVNQVEIHMS
jgi:hypothetical protein